MIGNLVRWGMLACVAVSLAACDRGWPRPGAPGTTDYIVSGSVSGVVGTGLVLQLNAVNNLAISTDGPFAFATTLRNGADYAVTVLSSPAGQRCSVTGGESRINRANVTNVAVTCVATTLFTVGGNIDAVTTTDLVLQLNAGRDLAITAIGPYTFATELLTGTPYTVTVLTPARNQTCEVVNGTGTVGNANVVNVDVVCLLFATRSFAVGGTVSGLTSGAVVLQNNRGDNLTVAANGAFQFASRLTNGRDYEVSVLTQPDGQFCVVRNGGGTIQAANVMSVEVSCAALDAPTYTVGGTVSGLTGGTMVLRNNGSDSLIVTANGAFQFASRLLNGSGFNVMVATPPEGQICAVTGGVGSISLAAVTSVQVVCRSINYTVGGTLSGLTAGSVGIQLNGDTTLSLSANGPFTFVPQLASGAAYVVTLTTQPAGQRCTVVNGAGNIADRNITTVQINCAPTYTVGGTVTGLQSGTLVLQNNGADALNLTANGAFVFPVASPAGSGYSVTVQTAPAGHTCNVDNGAGTIGNANVTQVVVTCSSSSASVYRVSRISYDLDNNGAIDAVRNIVYDAQGRPTDEHYVYTPDGVTDTNFGSFNIGAPATNVDTTYGYDSAGHLSLMSSIDASGRSDLNYDYGTDDLLDRYTINIFDTGGALSLSTYFQPTYLAGRMMRVENRSATDALMQGWDFLYDVTGRVQTDNRFTAAGTVTSQRDYTYSATGKIDLIHTFDPRAGRTLSQSDDFQYDGSDRLVAMITAQVGPVENYRWDYTIDTRGLQTEWRIDLSSNGSVEATVLSEWEEGPCADVFMWGPRAVPNFVASGSVPYAPGSGFAVLPFCARP